MSYGDIYNYYSHFQRTMYCDIDDEHADNHNAQISNGRNTFIVDESSLRAESDDSGKFGKHVWRHCTNLHVCLMKKFGFEPIKAISLTQTELTSIVEQAKLICRDHIYQRLAAKDMTKRLGFGGYNTVLSESYITACRILESSYPNVYTDVSRKIGRTMSTAGIVKATLNDVLEIMFRDSVTWGKVVSMFAIACAFAEECVQQGHPAFVNDVVNTVGGFVTLHLVEWVIRHGGWNGLERAFKETEKGFHSSVYIGVVGACVGMITITLSFVVGLR